ncbi:MAG TPA: NrfD/PsrC family molybdoenzyme membrane anchor subunit [Bacteroidota bacterium]|nr:NrfD/PsrC family molybdoenzyme membrane anchor subunit [Bacteroidota bacterium]
MNAFPDSVQAEPLLRPGHTGASITERITSNVLVRRTPRSLWVAFAVAFVLVMLLFYAVGYLLLKGVGIWGIRIPVAWGFAIVNFVWWIGIGHAGTLISAILLLLVQPWRNSINRFAEAMTLFAVGCAGLFPLLHLGRPWVFYWILPLPETMTLWPQFRSPLVWDVFAVATYFTISFIFWYVGLIPDLAAMRDRASRRWVQIAYGVLAMGWTGSARHWHRYETAYLLLAGLATPLVVSVHSVVSFDFAVSMLPGWHTTIFPPYFVAGAIYSGFAMVLSLVIPVRKVYGLEDFITTRHLDNMAKVMLATGLIVAYGYAMETFIAWYGGNGFELSMMRLRMFGPYGNAYWLLILCNILIPQLLWLRYFRQKPLALFCVSIVINVGMWLERYVIIVTSLARDFLPSSWAMYYPTFWDIATLAGTVGLFIALMFVFIRLMPMISMFELKLLLPWARGGGRATEDAE